MDYRHGLRYKEDNDMENEKDCATNLYFTADDGKVAQKRGVPQTRGTAISFGFRRRSRGDGHHQPIKNYEEELPPRSKSLGPEQVRRRLDDDDRHQRVQSASSGRSTPRLAPPKKEVVAGNVRMNRFGFRQPQPGRYTDKVADICSSHSASHFNQDKVQQQELNNSRSNSRSHHAPPSAKLRPSPVNNPPAYSNPVPSNFCETNRIARVTNTNTNISSNIPEPVSKYTLHTSHLPLPQYAVRVADANSKIAKTVANQNRKVSTASKSSAGSQSGSGTEDSGIGSQPGYLIDHEQSSMLDSASGVRRIQVRPRNLRMVVNGKSFDVRDVDDDNTVTEISVIPLPKAFASVNLSTGLVRERTSQYHQRITNSKDNRYCTTESITSMSTTSSEGYDEGLGEEKVFKDRARTEKVPSIKSDFSPPSSDDPEYGHGEAMADEYSFSSSDECRANNQRLKSIAPSSISPKIHPGAGLSLPKNTLRSVMLTIEDPAFAAAAASSTTLIDDETSPVDSLVDSLTASITQSDGQASKKEKIPVDKALGNVDDDSPGTPTNASNSLSLSEGREYFDDEIADQPGLTFDDTMRPGHETLSGRASRQVTDSSNTLMEPVSKTHSVQGKHIENSPLNCRRISRTGSVDTLSPCESITSDDLMLDYERSETSSYDEPHRRFESSPAIHEMDDATLLSELEAQGEEVMREWSSLLGTHPQISNSNLTNNNLIPSNNTNINQQISESGIGSARTSRLLRSRTGTDSPRSLDSVRTRQVPSPFRPVLTGNGQSPSLDSGDEGSPRLERCNYQQDIVYIKTGLLKLMRIIQEADTLNPFNNSMNGLFHNLNEDNTDSNGLLTNGALNIADELTDLRRQVIFLQGQLEDKDRAIQNLQLQVAKQQDLINSVDSQNSSVSYGSSTKDMSNAATQTEKIRPISAGPSLLQGFPQDNGMGPLVSWSETWNQNSSQRPLSIAEIGSNCTSSSNVKNNINNNNRKIDRPRTIKSRQEQIQASNRLLNGNSNNINGGGGGNNTNNNNGVAELEKDKSQIQTNSVVRRIIKPRDSASQIIDNEFTKEKSEAVIPKSCIPSLKKITPRVTRQTNISINRSHNA